MIKSQPAILFKPFDLSSKVLPQFEGIFIIVILIDFTGLGVGSMNFLKLILKFSNFSQLNFLFFFQSIDKLSVNLVFEDGVFCQFEGLSLGTDLFLEGQDLFFRTLDSLTVVGQLVLEFYFLLLQLGDDRVVI